MKTKFEITLFKKLNKFINKYYKNEILKGILFLITGLLLFLIIFSLIEHFSRLSSTYRLILFWLYIAINFVLFVKFILVPAFHLFRIGKRITYVEAGKIIGDHFPEIDDKIINLLDLNKLSENNNGLIYASIKQKTESINPFSFNKVVDFKENLKYVRWMSIPVLIFLMFFISGNKHIITESSARIIDYNTKYIPSAPFKFKIKNPKLNVRQHEDFLLNLKIVGDKVPSNVSIEILNTQSSFTLEKEGIDNYKFLFKNVNTDFRFRFYAEGYYSEYYDLNCLLTPDIIGLNIDVKYPDYTDIENETLINHYENLIVPEGSILKWTFRLRNTGDLKLSFDNNYTSINMIKNKAEFSKKILRSTEYSISTKNANIISDTLKYNIDVIKDEYPQITFNNRIDSVNNLLFFEIDASDDYGLSRLEMCYNVIKDDSTIYMKEEISINKLLKEKVYHMINIDSLSLLPSEELEYYFKVWDNDKVNGHKATKSELRKYIKDSKREVKEKNELQSNKIKNGIDKAINLSQEINHDLLELEKLIIDKKTLSWEEKRKVENILKKQSELENLINENNKTNNIKNKSQEKINPEILEKQNKLQELMNKVLDEESKKLMQELQEMLNEMDKEEMKDILDKINKENDDLENSLDRNLELYKELEFEQDLEEVINSIDDLKDKQEELKSKTEETDSNLEDLSKEQEDLEKELENIKKDLESIEKKNSELENKKNLPNLEEEHQDAEESMSDSKESLKKKQKNKSSKKQDEAIESLEEMSNMLNDLQSSCSSEQPVEDMETLREILENLLVLSFEQEDLMSEISSMSKNNNTITKHIQTQKKLSDDSKIIEDSLLALSKRVIQIESIINKEINSIKYHMGKSVSLLEERKIGNGVSNQQFVMTSINNLALLLSETLEQMQMDIANKTPGTKQCNKPGSSSKPSLNELKKMQKNLINEMKKGQKGQKGNKNGEKKSEGKSKELIRLANQQEQIRLRLQELRNEIGQNGDKGNIDRVLEKMEENEIDILNNNITKQTILRQQEILTRLLDAEESDREKDELDENRESLEWNYTIEDDSSILLDEHIKNKKKQQEILQREPLPLNIFFKEKVENYYKKLLEENK